MDAAAAAGCPGRHYPPAFEQIPNRSSTGKIAFAQPDGHRARAWGRGPDSGGTEAENAAPPVAIASAASQVPPERQGQTASRKRTSIRTKKD